MTVGFFGTLIICLGIFFYALYASSTKRGNQDESANTKQEMRDCCKLMVQRSQGINPKSSANVRKPTRHAMKRKNHENPCHAREIESGLNNPGVKRVLQGVGSRSALS